VYHLHVHVMGGRDIIWVFNSLLHVDIRQTFPQN
jgi:hypothetical protein